MGCFVSKNLGFPEFIFYWKKREQHISMDII